MCAKTFSRIWNSADSMHIREEGHCRGLPSDMRSQNQQHYKCSSLFRASGLGGCYVVEPPMNMDVVFFVDLEWSGFSNLCRWKLVPFALWFVFVSA